LCCHGDYLLNTTSEKKLQLVIQNRENVESVTFTILKQDMYTANTVPPGREKNYKSDIKYLGVTVFQKI
jgi:hypothetical protein